MMNVSTRTSLASGRADSQPKTQVDYSKYYNKNSGKCDSNIEKKGIGKPWMVSQMKCHLKWVLKSEKCFKQLRGVERHLG